jgi:hypothetical protein
MRNKWMVALLGAALCALMPAAALAHGPRDTHHVKRHHREHARIRHLHAAGSDSAGSVTSFDGTTLVITLTNGSTVSGAVTNDTEMSCNSSGQTTSMGSDTRADGGPGGGDDHGDRNDRGDNGDNGDRNDRGDNGNNDDNDGDEGNQMPCTTANLTPGTAVHKAELKISSAGSVWQQVDLITG